MQDSILDLSFLHELSDGDPVYMFEIIVLYLDSMPSGLVHLAALIDGGLAYDDIQKQAHFLKSSANIVKVTGIHGHLVEIEKIARSGSGIEYLRTKMDEVKNIFSEALPLIEAEKEKYRNLVAAANKG